ncbi:MAG: hypothetical protein JW861_03090 [Bacteroidales bacterium]|nr:hypothetical protein [Bacteroidales bacterium]
MKRMILTAALLIMAASFIYSQQCTSCSPGSIITGLYSSALGIDNTSSGEASFASGKNNTAQGMYSMALGYGIQATGNSSVALGLYNTASGAYSIGIGTYLQATQTRSLVIGTGYNFDNPLISNIPNSLMLGFGSNKSTLFVSTAPANGKTGKMGLGDITSPSAKLHIKADLGEEAALLVEPHTWSGSSWAEIRLGDNQNAVRAYQDKGLEFRTSHNCFFSQGNVGIGTSTPGEKLDVAGNIRTTGFLLNDGSQGEGKFLKCSANGSATWSVVPDDGDWTVAGDNIFRLNGNMGLGTATPGFRVHIRGAAELGLQNETMCNNAGDPLAVIHFGSSYGSNEARISVLRSGTGGSGGNTPTDIAFLTTPQGQYQNPLERMRICQSGNIGIGTSSPSSTLHVNGGLKVEYLSLLNGVQLTNDADITGADQIIGYNDLRFYGDNGTMPDMFISPDGKVGIGNTAPQALLHVSGVLKAQSLDLDNMTVQVMTVTDKLWAGEIEVTEISEWKDMVFDPDYQLMPLDELQNYIEANGHLPGVPAESEVMANGINLAEMNALLLQKIEELTLYVLELNRRQSPDR